MRSPLDAALIAEAAAVAASADVAIVMVGLPGIAESEGFDRETLALPAQHDALVAAVTEAQPRTVVALSVGSPVLLPWRDDVAAILLSYLGGQASGAALADALLGVVEPAGRLAETWPAAQSDVAADPYFPGDLAQVHYREGVFVGYRHATHRGVSLRPTPSGTALGYGSSDWGSARVSAATLAEAAAVTVSAEVTNTSDRPRRELVQVYAHDRSGVVLRPRRELVGFARATIEPGATATVEVDVTADALRFWDVRAHDWALPRGTVALEVARSSESIEAVLEIEVLGSASDSAERPNSPAIAASDEQWARRLGRAIPSPTLARPFTARVDARRHRWNPHRSRPARCGVAHGSRERGRPPRPCVDGPHRAQHRRTAAAGPGPNVERAHVMVGRGCCGRLREPPPVAGPRRASSPPLTARSSPARSAPPRATSGTGCPLRG